MSRSSRRALRVWACLVPVCRAIDSSGCMPTFHHRRFELWICTWTVKCNKYSQLCFLQCACDISTWPISSTFNAEGSYILIEPTYRPTRSDHVTNIIHRISFYPRRVWISKSYFQRIWKEDIHQKYPANKTTDIMNQFVQSISDLQILPMSI